MRLGGLSRAFWPCAFWAGVAWGQTSPTSARIETVPLRLTMPDDYQVTIVLEPARRVMVVAPADGVIQSLEVRPGGTVRESQELAQLDRTEANAKVRMAAAEVQEKEALVKASDRSPVAEVYRAQLEAARARAELAQLELNRCTIRAPFAGRVLAVPVSTGQYILKGTPIAELADVTSLRAIVPVDRRAVAAGSTVTVAVEERQATGKVQAVLPLPDSFARLRELATPFAAAVVIVPNTRGDLEPGLRVRPPGVPTSPIAAIPKRAVRADEVRGAAGSMVQVIRNEYVTNVPIQILGGVGPERVQVSGLLREHDALILGSSVPLIPGTLVRFGDGVAGRAIEGTSPNPAHGGFEAGITPPGAASNRSATAPRRAIPAPRPVNPPSQSSTQGATPF